MGISADGNSLTITDCDITFNNAFDPSTGIATITITPKGGIGTLPGVLQGQPGLPPVFRKVNYTPIPFGQALPDPPASLTMISPGGPGVASVYDLDIAVNSGPGGPAGATSLSDMTDVSGSSFNQAVLTWDQSTNNWIYTNLPFMGLYVPQTINSTSGSAASRVLASVTVPALTYKWVPMVSAQCVVSGTANTRVDLMATEVSPSGVRVAYGYGYAGQTSSSAPVVVSATANTNLSSVQVPAGQAETIYLSAVQQNSSTTDNWSTSQGTTTFSVWAMPVL